MSEIFGRAVWRELLCPRTSVAAEFVNSLFAWKAEPARDGFLLRAGERPIGALRDSEGDERPAWLIHIAVEKLDAALEKVESLGGEVTGSGPELVAGLGRRARILDPFGAPCYLVEPSTESSVQADSATPGDFFWVELTCDQPRLAVPFFGGLLGWTAEATPIGDLELYRFSCADQAVASAVADPDLGGGNWISYVSVSNVRTACDRARELGGEVYRKPVSLPMGTFAGILDPAGARLALWQQSD